VSLDYLQQRRFRFDGKIARRERVTLEGLLCAIVWFVSRAFLAAATASSKRRISINAMLIPPTVEKRNGSNGLKRIARSKLR
jgi:hypothetical protein